VLAQSQPLEQFDRIGRQDLARRLARIERKQDGDQPAHDVRIAVAREVQERTGRAVALHFAREPHLAGTALHLVRFASLGLRQRRKAAAELDHIPVAIVPIVQQGEILDDLVDRHGSGGAVLAALDIRPAGQKI
jgi:hypothetical protein